MDSKIDPQGGDEQTKYGICLERCGLSIIDEMFNTRIQAFYRQESDYQERMRLLRQVQNHIRYFVKKKRLIRMLTMYCPCWILRLTFWPIPLITRHLLWKQSPMVPTILSRFIGQHQPGI